MKREWTPAFLAVVMLAACGAGTPQAGQEALAAQEARETLAAAARGARAEAPSQASSFRTRWPTD